LAALISSSSPCGKERLASSAATVTWLHHQAQSNDPALQRLMQRSQETSNTPTPSSRRCANASVVARDLQLYRYRVVKEPPDTLRAESVQSLLCCRKPFRRKSLQRSS
jgi:hypothetical protein